MPPQITIPPEDGTTRGTLVGLEVGVGEEVRLEVAALVEGAAAGGTLMWRLLHMKDLVDGQGTTLAEPFTTLTTLKRLLLAVDVPVEDKGVVSQGCGHVP